MLLSIPSAICETLKKTRAMKVSRDSVFNMTLDYRTYCRIRNVALLQCSSLWIPNDFRSGEKPDVSSSTGSPACHHNVDCKIISHQIL